MKRTRLLGLLCVITTVLLSTPALADFQTDEVIAKLRDTYRKMRTLQADVTITGTCGPNKTSLRFTGHARLKKPNLWHYTVQGRVETERGRPRKYLLVSDGKTSTKVSLLRGVFVQEPAVQKDYILCPNDPLTSLFFFEDWLTEQTDNHRTVRLLPAQKVDGVECGILEIVTLGIDTRREIQFYIGADYLVRRVREKRLGMGGNEEVEINFTKMQMDKEIPARLFAYRPSPFLKRSEQPLTRAFWFGGFLKED